MHSPALKGLSQGQSYEGAKLVCVLVAETIHPVCMCEGGGRGGERGGHTFYYTYIYSLKGQSCEGAKLVCVLVAETTESILCSCVREEDAGGRETDTHSTTPAYTVRRDCPAREPSWSVFWLQKPQKPSILRACVREEDTGGRESVAHSTTPTYTV